MINPKIKKLRAERQKNDQRIEKYRARNVKIDKEVTELENLDIIGMVRSIGMTPEQLEALIDASTKPAPAEEAAHA